MHPDLDFYIRFPRGWYTANSNSAVGAQEPRGRAVVFLTADAPPGEPRKIAETWAAKTQQTQPINIEESKHVKVGHIDAWRMKVGSSSGGASVTSLVTFIPYSNATWRVTAMSRARDADQYLGRTLVTARSFRPLTDEERGSIVEAILHVTQAQAGDSLERLGERSGNAWDARTTALYNGLFVNHRFNGGELVKTVRVRPYHSPAEGPSQGSQPGPTPH
jgi:predicted Zn-dependent protease